jgi:hypothetical protein
MEGLLAEAVASFAPAAKDAALSMTAAAQIAELAALPVYSATA